MHVHPLPYDFNETTLSPVTYNAGYPSNLQKETLKMFRHLLVTLFVCGNLMVPAGAQGIRPDALRLAEFAMNDSWDALKPMLDASLESLEQKARAVRGANPTTGIFIDELKKSFSKENFTQTIAAAFSEQMTEAELKEALAFTTSATGRKFVALSKSMGDGKYMGPFVLDACNRTRARLQAARIQPDSNFEQACRN